jgi:RNA polymerase-binding protein DksA
VGKHDCYARARLIELKEKDLQEFRDMLSALRRRLSNNVNSMQNDAPKESGRNGAELSDMPMEHLADRASDNFVKDMMIGLLQNSEAEIVDIDIALEKIDNSTYGQCENCEGTIDIERLKALPFARLCIQCKQEEEQQTQ